MLLDIMHNLGWYDVTFDSPCRTVGLRGIRLGDNKRCSVYRHWGK